MENIDIKNTLVEDTTGAAAPEIATTDENLSVDAMYQQAELPSLGRQIFSVIPMNGPTAALFNLRKKSGTTDVELVRAEVEVEPSTSIHTGISLEAIQDLRAQYGKEVGAVVGTLLRGLTNDQENTATLAFLDSKAKSEAALSLSSAGHAENNLFEITQKVHELVLKANSKNMRTYQAFCVLPFSAGAAIAALSNYVGGEDKDERGLFLAEVGQTKFFMNPDATSDVAYVGLKDSRNPSKSAAVFSPYRDTIVEAQDPNTGASTYHIYNRFAITASPLHESNNEMIFKFQIS
jgi:hypothetical protein